MPATNPTISHPYTTTFHYSTDGGDNYTALSNVNSITPPRSSKGFGDATTLNATNAIKRKVRGWMDQGNITVRLLYTDAVMTTLLSMSRRTPLSPNETYKITFPILPTDSNGATLVINGFITEGPSISEGSVDSDDLYEIELTIEADGGMTFTEGS